MPVPGTTPPGVLAFRVERLTSPANPVRSEGVNASDLAAASLPLATAPSRFAWEVHLRSHPHRLAG